MEAVQTTTPQVDTHGHNEADIKKPPRHLQQNSNHKEDHSGSGVRAVPQTITRQPSAFLLPATFEEAPSHLVLPTWGSGSFAHVVADLKESGDIQAFVNATAATDIETNSVAGSEKGMNPDLNSSQSESQGARPGSATDTSSGANLIKFDSQQRHEHERDFELVGVKRDLTAIKTKKVHSIAVTAKTSTPTTMLTPSGKVGGRLDELSVNSSSSNAMASIDITSSKGHESGGDGSEANPNIGDLFSTIMSSVNEDSNGLGLGPAANRMLKDATGMEIKSGDAHGEAIVNSVLEKIDESQSLASSVPARGHGKHVGQETVGDEGRGALAVGNPNHKRSSEHGASEAAATTNMDEILSSIMSKKKTESTSTLISSSKSMAKSGAKSKLVRGFSFTGINHIAFCVENLERSLDFYCGMLGLEKNLDRPDLPYRGAWLFLGTEGIHIMEVPNPDPVDGRPDHGGFDRHACINCMNVEGVKLALDAAGVSYQASVLPSVFTRDPDGNGLEFIEVSASKYNFLDA